MQVANHHRPAARTIPVIYREIVVRRVLLLLALIATACSKPTPKASSPEDEYQAWLNEGEAPRPENVEWLYALKDYQGDHAGECVEIHQVLQGERDCQGAVCKHAVRLGQDWLSLCKANPDQSVTAALKSLLAKLETRAQEGPSDCARQVEAWLHDGCGKDAACLPAARGWATDCAAKLRSPLTLTMLEQKIETSYAPPRRVSLDTRPCKVLGEEVVKAAHCKQQFDCEDALPALETYRAKCVEEGAAMPPRLALAALTLLFIAKKGSAVPAAAAPEALSISDTPLPLADGSGAIIQVCNERPTSVANYVGATKGCDDHVLVARFFPDKPHRVLRAAWVPHPDAETFWRNYPGLMVWGLATKRDQELVRRFETELQGAAQLAEHHPAAPEPRGKLLLALEQLPQQLLRATEVQNLLTRYDAQFVATLDALGKEKAKQRPPSTPDLLAYVHRSMELPFADVRVTGEIQVGAATAGSVLHLEDLMPRSYAAYVSQFRRLERSVRYQKLRDNEADELENSVVQAAVGCKRLHDDWTEAVSGLQRCAFATQACDPEVTSKWERDLVDARTRAKAAWVATELAIASLDPAPQIEARAAAKEFCPGI